MSTIHSVTATFESARPGACKEQEMWRVKADENVLFVLVDNADEAAVLSRIPAGATVKMGVEPLADGTFWLHWLHSQKYGTLDPRRGYGVGSKAVRRLALGVFLLFGAVAAIWLLFPKMRHDATATPFFLLMAVCGYIYLYAGLRALAPITGGKLRAVRETLRQATQASPPDSLSLAPIEGRQKGTHGVAASVSHEGAPGLFAEEGTAERIDALAFMGGGKRNFFSVTYDFSVNGRRVAANVAEHDSSDPALLRKMHPFMIAEGDRVRVVLEKNEKTVRAVMNLEDGCAYWLSGGMGAGAIPATAKNAALAIGVGAPLLLFGAGFAASGSVGAVWETFWLPGLACVFIGLALPLLALGVRSIRRAHWKFRDAMPFILRAMEAAKEQNGQKKYLHEL